MQLNPSFWNLGIWKEKKTKEKKNYVGSETIPYIN